MATWSLFCRHIWKVPRLLFLSLKSHHLFTSHCVHSASPFAKWMASYFPPFSYFPLDSPAPLSFTELCFCVHHFSSCPATCTASVRLEEGEWSWDVLAGRSGVEWLLQHCCKTSFCSTRGSLALPIAVGKLAVYGEALKRYAQPTRTTPLPCNREWLIQHSLKHGPGPCGWTPRPALLLSLPPFCGCRLVCFSVSSSNFFFLWAGFLCPTLFFASHIKT